MVDQPQYPVVNSDEANYIKRFGDPRSPGWQQQNIVTIQSPSGVKFQVNKVAAPAFQAFVNEMENDAGYKFRQADSSSYNLRNITGGNTLSPHAFGVGFDGNSLSNPYGKVLKTDMPADVAQRAAKYGIAWGGNFADNKDPMHFEYVGLGDQAKSMYAATQPQANDQSVGPATQKLAEAIQEKNRIAATAAEQADQMNKLRMNLANQSMHQVAAKAESDQKYAQYQRLNLISKLLPQPTTAANPFATNITPWAQPMAPPASPLTTVLPLMQIAALSDRSKNPLTDPSLATDPALAANPPGTR